MWTLRCTDGGSAIIYYKLRKCRSGIGRHLPAQLILKMDDDRVLRVNEVFEIQNEVSIGVSRFILLLFFVLLWSKR
jgi:hypothetical protein